MKDTSMDVYDNHEMMLRWGDLSKKLTLKSRNEMGSSIYKMVPWDESQMIQEQ